MSCPWSLPMSVLVMACTFGLAILMRSPRPEEWELVQLRADEADEPVFDVIPLWSLS